MPTQVPAELGEFEIEAFLMPGVKRDSAKRNPILLYIAVISLTIALGVAIIYLVNRNKSTGEGALAFSFLMLCTGGAFVFIWYVSGGAQCDIDHFCVHPQGISFSRDNNWTAYRWDEIECVFHRSLATSINYGAFVHSNWCCVQFTDQSKIYLTAEWMDQGMDAANHFLETVQQIMLPDLKRKYALGEKLQFGSLSVSQWGIEKGGRLLEWNEFHRISVCNGIVAIQKRGGLVAWHKQELFQIPNCYVFLALINDVAPTR